MQPTLHYDSYWSNRGSDTCDPIHLLLCEFFFSMRMFEQHTKSTALHSVMSGCPLTLQHWSLSSLLGNFISLPASQWVSRLLIDRFRYKISIDGGRYFD